MLTIEDYVDIVLTHFRSDYDLWELSLSMNFVFSRIYLIRNLAIETNMNNEIKTKNRIKYLDAMRGFCILLVVYGHLEMETSVNAAGSIFSTFRMPLFFFLSGFLCYSSFTPLSVNKFKRRTFGQLLPTIITGSIFIILMRNGDFEDALFDKSKAGYWFTLVAFEIYLLYAVFSYAVDHNHSK